MGAFQTLDDMTDIAGKRVLVRVDFNVPLAEGQVSDATRIERTLPTIADLSAKGAKVILMTHMGRPKGQALAEFSLEQILPELRKHVPGLAFAPDCVGEAAEAAVARLGDGDVLLLENLRYHAGEEKNDGAFVDQLAALGDLFVNDAFATAHRAHASTEGLAHKLPAYAGRTMEQELKALDKALATPERPVVAVVGGAKVSTKLDLLNNLIGKADKIVIGGGMANTFLAAQGVNVGKSLCEHDLLDTARAISTKADANDCELILPKDVVVAKAFEAHAPSRACAANDVAADEMILDLGPQSAAALDAVFGAAKTVVWNGPLGAFEIAPFDVATVAAAQSVAKHTSAGSVVSVAGGGDTVAALNHAGVGDTFSYVSTAGGAFLEWLEGRTLPGVAALESSAA